MGMAQPAVPQLDVRRIADGAGVPEAARARALDAAGAAYAEMEQQRATVADAESHSTARSGYLMGVARLRESLRGVPPEEMEARWQAGVRALRQEHGSSLSSRAQRQFNANQGRIDSLGRLGLAHRRQHHARRVASGGAASGVDAASHRGDALGDGRRGGSGG